MKPRRRAEGARHHQGGPRKQIMLASFGIITGQVCTYCQQEKIALIPGKLPFCIACGKKAKR